MNITTIGIDIAKEVFELRGIDESGSFVLKRQLKRAKLKEFMVKQPSCTVVMEACGGSNYWAREFTRYGHEVKLIAPQYVKPFVKGNKNDGTDAEGIVVASRAPGMRFVSIKTVEQQDWQSLLRIREGYIEMRTKIGNQIRGLLAEYGVAIPKGVSNLRKALPDLFDRMNENGLTLFLKELLATQYNLLIIYDDHILDADKKLKQLAESEEVCKRLMAIEGVGVITAVALYALVGKRGEGFKNGRHFSAFLGLVPRQHSSGGKDRLLGISKRGDGYIRKVLIHGARSIMIRADKKKDSRSQWISELKKRVGMNKACVAVANKNARIAMAILLSGEAYKKAA